MAEVLENLADNPFTADPVRMETEAGTAFTYDATDDELDSVDTGEYKYARLLTAPGSFEHEGQCTFLMTAEDVGYLASPAVRGNNGTDRYSALVIPESFGVGGTVFFFRGSTQMNSQSFALTQQVFYTIRMAAEGANGGNVTLSIWLEEHTATKPADPGWIGDDGSPDLTYTDTNVARLDDDSAHLYCGLGGYDGASGHDSRICFIKARNISDRGGGGAAGLLPIHGKRQNTLVRM